MKQISLRLPDDLYDEVERERGLVPRETWIKDKLASAVEHGARTRETPIVPTVVKRYDEKCERARIAGCPAFVRCPTCPENTKARANKERTS